MATEEPPLDAVDQKLHEHGFISEQSKEKVKVKMLSDKKLAHLAKMREAKKKKAEDAKKEKAIMAEMEKRLKERKEAEVASAPAARSFLLPAGGLLLLCAGGWYVVKSMRSSKPAQGPAAPLKDVVVNPFGPDPDC